MIVENNDNVTHKLISSVILGSFIHSVNKINRLNTILKIKRLS